MRLSRALVVVGVLAFPAAALAGILAKVSQEPHVEDQETCQAPVESLSSVAGASGSLKFSLDIAPATGAPGPPVHLQFMYSSGGDDPGTYGTNINVSAKYQDLTKPYSYAGVDYPGDPAYEILDWPAGQAKVTAGRWHDGESVSAGWGKPTSANPSHIACNSMLEPDETAGPPSWPATAPDQTQDQCVGGHSEEAQWREAVFQYPIRVGSELPFNVQAAPCRSSPVPWTDAGVGRAQVGLTAHFVGRPVSDPSGPPVPEYFDYCYGGGNKPLYLEKRADPDIARMGVNWTHSYAWHFTSYFPDQGTSQWEVIHIFHSPSGGKLMFREPTGQDEPTWARYEIPAVSDCECSGIRLFRSYRHEPPVFGGFDMNGFPLNEKTYELLLRDGTRYVFHGSHPIYGNPNNELLGRLGKIEELRGLNATRLYYTVDSVSSAVELWKVADSSGLAYEFVYSDTPSGRRLTRVIVPGAPTGADVTMAYDSAGRLNQWRDPVLSATPTLAPWSFTYDDTAPDGMGANDIKTKTSPDGQVVEYTYYPLPSDGKPDGRAGNVQYADLKSGPGLLERIHYVYGVKRTIFGSGETADSTSWVIVEHIDPVTGLESATHPRMRYDFLADGRLVRTTTICNEESTCPFVSLSASHPQPERITEVIEETKYDALDRPSVTTRWARGPDAPPPATPIDWQSYFSRTCTERDAAGNVTAVLGPRCIESTGAPTLPDWGTCDCEAWLSTHAGPRPTGAVVTWESVVAPDWPSLLVDQDNAATNYRATYERVKSITPASEATYPFDPDAPAWRVYYCSTETDTFSDGQVQAICPPSHPDPPYPANAACDTLADEGCETFLWAGGHDLGLGPGPTEASRWLASHFDGLLGQSTHGRDADSHLLTDVTDAFGRTTTFKYFDGSARLKTVTAPGELTTSFTWNVRGQLATSSAPGGIDTGYGYSPQGRLRVIADLSRPPHAAPLSGDRVSWWFTHDPARGLPTHVARGDVQFTEGQVFPLTSSPTADDSGARIYETRSFNADGLVTMVEPPLGSGETGSIRLFHDGFGNLWKREIDRPDFPVPLPRRECYRFDPRLGALSSVRFDLSLADPTCDLANNLPPSGTETAETFTHDVSGALIQETFQWTSGSGVDRHVTCHERDAFGRLIATHSDVQPQVTVPLCEPDGAMTQDETFDWNVNDQLVGTTTRHDGVETAVVTLDYDAAGRLSARTEAISGYRLDYFRRPNGEIKQMWRMDTNAPGLNPPWRIFEFTRDDAGRLTEVLDRPEPPEPVTDRAFTTYAYDGASRLKRATHQKYGRVETYDKGYGYASTDPWNIATIEDFVSSTTETFDHDDDDRIVSPSGWTYDARGNVTSDPVRGPIYWSLDGRLLAANKDGVLHQYRYDPLNRLVARWTDGPSATLTMHLWDGWKQAGEYSTAGSGDRTLSMMASAGSWLGQGTPTGTTMFAHDQQGSVTHPITATPIYEPFGDLASGVLQSKMAFQSQEWREESGLQYMRNRWYAADAGRWMSRDPLTQSTVSSYEFLGGDPIHRIDPLGQDWMDTTAAVSAGVGDALLMGYGDELRGWTDQQFGWQGSAAVDRCSSAYAVSSVLGSVAMLTVGAGRLGYAGAARGIRATATTYQEAVAARNTLKVLARAGIDKTSRIYSAEAALAKYGGDAAAVIAASGRTSTPWNLAGGLGVSGAVNGLFNLPECGCPD